MRDEGVASSRQGKLEHWPQVKLRIGRRLALVVYVSAQALTHKA
jgi:hypothetical protein